MCLIQKLENIQYLGLVQMGKANDQGKVTCPYGEEQQHQKCSAVFGKDTAIKKKKTGAVINCEDVAAYIMRNVTSTMVSHTHFPSVKTSIILQNQFGQQVCTASSVNCNPFELLLD